MTWVYGFTQSYPLGFYAQSPLDHLAGSPPGGRRSGPAGREYVSVSAPTQTHVITHLLTRFYSWAWTVRLPVRSVDLWTTSGDPWREAPRPHPRLSMHYWLKGPTTSTSRLLPCLSKFSVPLCAQCSLRPQPACSTPPPSPQIKVKWNEGVGESDSGLIVPILVGLLL